MRFNDFISKPYALNLAIKSSCGRQPKTFDRSANKVPKAPPPLSTLSHHFSIIVVITLAKTTLVLKSILSKYCCI